MQDKENLEEKLNQEGTEEAVEEKVSEVAAPAEGAAEAVEDKFDDVPLDKNVKLMSPFRMVVRRFFRSKLSIVGIVILVVLLIFSWFGPVVYRSWGEIEVDRTGKTEYTVYEISADDDSGYGESVQLIASRDTVNKNARPSSSHLLGTDPEGMDILARLMYGGRLSLAVSFIAVILTAVLGVIFGGLAGYYGGWVDDLIMRICDILMCLPTLPLMLILGTVLDTNGVPSQYYIYILMGLLSIFSWTGMARLVRGQILFLREQEYMVAAEAMGYSPARRIFKHLVPNVLPQIIVSMTMSLGSMILYESTLSYLGLGVKLPYASWGTMISILSPTGVGDAALNNYPWTWIPSGICIILAVLAFNFIGDGLRDALDPKQRR